MPYPYHQPPTSNTPRAPRAALVVALALRLAVPILSYACGTAPDFYYEPDTKAYLLTSQSLLETGRFARADAPEVFRTPGYPIFLMLGVALERVTLSAIALQIALSLGTVILAHRLAWLLFARRDVATAAAWLAACEPVSILYTAKLLTETLFTFLFVFSIERAVAYVRYSRLRDLLFAGLLLAAATYTRPVGYYWAPVLVALLLSRLAWCRRQRARQLAHLAAFATLLLATILPWQVRNDRQTGYAGFSSWPVDALTYYSQIVERRRPGESLTEALNHARFLDDVEFAEQHDKQSSWPLAQRFARQRHEALVVLRGNPGTTAIIYGQGVAATAVDNGMSVAQGLLGEWIPADDDSLAKAKLTTLGRLGRAIQLRPAFVLLYVLLQAILVSYIGLTALGTGGGRPVSRLALAIVCVAILYLLLVSGGPFGSHRMRVPMMPLMSVVAAAGLCRLKEFVERRRALHE